MIEALWAVSTSLEFFGAYLALKRRNWILLSLTLFMAESDVALVPIRIFASQWIYSLSCQIQLGMKYGLMCLLAIYISSKLVRAEKPMQVGLCAAIVTLAGAGVVIRIFSDGATWEARFQDAENAANIIVLMVLCVAWISRSERLKAPWRMITAGLLVMVLSDFGITLLCNVFPSAWKIYPLGAIPAYAMWCWAMRKGYPAANEIPLLIKGRRILNVLKRELAG